MVRKNKNRRYVWTVFVTGSILIGSMVGIIVVQNDKSKWTTKKVRVQFQEETGLQDYNGCYSIDDEGDGHNGRHAYKNEKNENNKETPTAFGYCKNERTWILFIDEYKNINPCKALGLIHSTRTDTFDISMSLDDTWTSSSGTPMDLYFFEDENDLHCGLYLNDGICDQSFNKIAYQYDEGDCCAATCTHPNCGIEGLTSAFGNGKTNPNFYGDGFPNCIDPSMVPITIRLDNIYGNHNDILTTDWREFYEDVGMLPPSSIEELIEKHFDKESRKPLLSFDCNGKNVMHIYVSKRMESASETVLVEEGASCTLTIQNSTGDTNGVLHKKVPILHINYTVFHGGEKDITKNPIVITSQQTSTQGIFSFNVVPRCYFENLMDHFDNTTIYTGSNPANEAINWLMDDKSGNSACEHPFFVERYALIVMNFVSATAQLTDERRLLLQASSSTLLPAQANDSLLIGKTKELKRNLLATGNLSSSSPSSAPSTSPNSTNILLPWISSQQQCLWTQITCKGGSVYSLILEPGTIAGPIGTEIGLLTNLENLVLVMNTLTGTLPNELFSLTGLTSLLIARNEFSGTIPTEIGLLTNLISLDYNNNNFAGTIPTEIGSFTDLTRLTIYNNAITGPLPSEIGLMTSLELFWCHYNMLTGTIPTELGLMTSLEGFYLMDNKLTGAIPTEIELLTTLEELYINDNFISGTIPGNLTYIQRISLFNTSITCDSIPNSYDSVIFEPCIICDGERNVDFFESIDETGISLGDECSTSINEISNDFPWTMLTIDECSILIKRCVVCRKDNTERGQDNIIKSSSNSTRKKEIEV